MDLLFILLIIVFMQLRERKLNRNRLWLLPVLLLYACFSSLIKMDNYRAIDLWIIAALTVIGLIAGWIRGYLYTIRRDNQTHQLIRKGNVLTVLLLLALIVAKMVVQSTVIPSHAEHLLSVIQAGFLFEIFGSFTGRNLALWVRSASLLKKDSMGE